MDARRLQQVEAVLLRLLAGDLVRQDDALLELFESQRAEDGATAQRLACELKLLVVDVEARLGVPDEDAGGEPGFEVVAGEGVVVGGGVDVGAVLAVVDAGDVVGAAVVEVEPRGAGDDVVGRRDQVRGVAGDRGVVAQGAEGSQFGHAAMIGGRLR